MSMGWEISWFTTTDGFSENFDVPVYFGLNVFLRDGEEVFHTYSTSSGWCTSRVSSTPTTSSASTSRSPAGL
jgi:Bacterial protein of unknown function (DUF899)